MGSHQHERMRWLGRIGGDKTAQQGRGYYQRIGRKGGRRCSPAQQAHREKLFARLLAERAEREAAERQRAMAIAGTVRPAGSECLAELEARVKELLRNP
jgi:hypothetical protein